MAGVESGQKQMWGKRLMCRLVDIVNFVALTSVSTAVLLALIKNSSDLRITITAVLNLIIYFLTIFNGSTKWIFPAEILFLVLLHILPITSATFAVLVLICYIWLAACFVSIFAIILFIWEKGFSGTTGYSFISVETKSMIMEDVFILAVNVCASLFGWFMLQQVRSTSDFMRVWFIGFVSSLSCVFRLLYKWNEYRMAGSKVSSVASPTNGAAV